MNRSWRLQQWDIRGGPPASQPSYAAADPLMYPMPMASHPSQDAYLRGSEGSQPVCPSLPHPTISGSDPSCQLSNLAFRA